MILIFQIVCLCITLLVLQKYITTDTYSRTHRLLPLVLGLLAVFNFFQIVETISGETEIFATLYDLLLIQSLHLLMFYTLDFLQIHLPKLVENSLYVLLVSMDLLLFWQLKVGGLYSQTSSFITLGYVIIIVCIATFAYIRGSFSKRENRVTNLVYIAFLMPAVAVFAAELGERNWRIWISIALAFTCCIIYYLLATDQLTDSLYTLQEQQYATADIAVVSFDADCYYMGANEAAKRLFPRELSVPARKTKPELYMDDIKQMARMMEHPKIIEHQGHFYKCQLNSVYYHERLKGYNLSIIDITEQKNETKLMASLKDAAEDKNALKSRFLATMSHDLRSPLHAIIGISDILTAQRGISGKNRALLMHIKSAGETLLTQVDAILDYSKLEAGRLVLAKDAYHLDSILEELAHMSVINLQSKPVKFILDMKDEHPRYLVGDEMRVREIIQNLLANAAKYTKQGEIRCEVRCELNEKTKMAYITCQVSDTGAGMSQEQLEQIFDEYVTFSGGRIAHGSGLGLCIVKQLAELMNGNVFAISDGVSGSTVSASFYQEYEGEEMLPPFQLDGDTILRQTTAYNRNVKPAFTYPKAKVLLAEDMRINQEIFRELVSPWEFDVEFAYNGKEAVDMAKNGEYQMIFLDQMMPEMMGDEAAAQIREITDVPIILITANLTDGMRNEYLKIGFTDFVAKPIELPVLQKTIEQHMPREYRYDSSFEEVRGIFPDNLSKGKANKRTLETFVHEVEPLAEMLPVYVDENMELFRIKTHGIKGASRQIGKITLSEKAEIMEMAAKTDNMNYIETHMEDFCRELIEAVREARQELENIPTIQMDEQTEVREKQDLFAQLKEGFDNYQLSQIEDAIRALEGAVLTAEELELLEQAKVACDEMDYEEGSALFS